MDVEVLAIQATGSEKKAKDAEGVSNESEKVEMALNVYAPNGKVATHRECT